VPIGGGGGGGGERLARSKSGFEYRTTAISAYDDVYDRARLLAAGFQDYLVKPVSIRELCRVISQLAARAVAL